MTGFLCHPQRAAPSCGRCKRFPSLVSLVYRVSGMLSEEHFVGFVIIKVNLAGHKERAVAQYRPLRVTREIVSLLSTVLQFLHVPRHLIFEAHPCQFSFMDSKHSSASTGMSSITFKIIMFWDVVSSSWWRKPNCSLIDRLF